MSATRRIIYHVPGSSTGPSGGVKEMLEHVEILREAGFDAVATISTEAQRPTSFQTKAPIICLEQERVPWENAVLVNFEGAQPKQLLARSRAGVRQAVFVQNHYFCYRGLGGARSWRQLGVRHVFCPSWRIKRYLESHGIAENVPVIPLVVTPPSVPAAGKREQIAYMPRKRPSGDWQFIRQSLWLRYPELAEVPWVPIEKRPHAAAMRILAESAVFLSLQFREGFGLPALEAMAADCLVAGFAGDGGRDYASPANGYWAGDDDLEGAADALAQALRDWRADRSAARRAAARATAARFGPEPRRAALIAMWRRILDEA